MTRAEWEAIDPQDEYVPTRRLLDCEERYWPEWAFENENVYENEQGETPWQQQKP